MQWVKKDYECYYTRYTEDGVVEQRYYRHKQQREIKRFLLFPKTIGAITRWLELAAWKQMWQGGFWIDTDWLNLDGSAS
jgi:hypothetical protein